ncbi:hypothetical protein TH9_05605 [Thalassospira xiamenensis]|uniref:hypothetical protein n=1 Tax=Thalassospira xiamenensis TaxID=220697 RepID=UPI000DEDB96B|nr:hypothetical protein [Thalassospira xiamenensis]RCK36126.1 hypothetical protein TH9_05605 [Thalassospira xiamenensis]
MKNGTPWLTVIVLYAFAAFLGGMVAVSYLSVVGAIVGFDLSIEAVTFADIAGPLISAVGIVVTALIAYSGWMRQQDELRAQREEELQQRRNMAKLDRIPLSHILNEIIDVCRMRDDNLASLENELIAGRRVIRTQLAELVWPLDLVERIRNVARYQEDPFLQSLLSLVQDMQVKKARSSSFDRKFCTGYEGHREVNWRPISEYYREVFELHVLWATCLALFDAARSRTSDIGEYSCSPSEEIFWNAARLSNRTVDQRFCREARMLLEWNGGVRI